ncbi:MAG: CBS domain-containing protein [Chloroflexota bacterium]
MTVAVRTIHWGITQLIERGMLMQTIRVEEVYKLHGIASIAIPLDSTLEEVINRFADDPRLRGIFLVDSRGRFAGEVALIHLMKWVHLRLYGASGVVQHHGSSGVGRAISAWEVSRLVSATKARDVARGDWRDLGVKESDTLQAALNKMVEHETNILPVLDDQGRILGDLKLSEVLLKVIEVGRQG